MSRALSPTDAVAAIRRHSAGLAEAAAGALDRDVVHCPGWTVADLVAHVSDVHWSWATIVEQHLQQPVAPEDRPVRAADDELVATFVERAEHLAAVLEDADPTARVWTWAPGHQDAGFVVRHQVQEILVHHWDAVTATGGSLALDPALAADAVDEFLEVSVSTDADPAEPGAPELDGTIVLQATDTGDAWRVTAGDGPSTTRTTRTTRSTDDADATYGPDAIHSAGATTVAASAADLLLWLYGRLEIEVADPDQPVLQRFRELMFTD